MMEVYRVDDLRGGLVPEGARLAVLGYPVSHSASPQMHQAALDALGLEMSYIRVEVEPGCVREVLGLLEGLGFLGCNVTIPHKLEAMECCDVLSDAVRALGVANTIHFRGGEIFGDSTDGPGLVRAIEEDFGMVLEGARVLVLGAGGGAGKAISMQLHSEGCADLYLSNRTVSKVEELRAGLPDSGTVVHVLGNDAAGIDAVIGGVDLVINATSMGMGDDDDLPMSVGGLGSGHRVYDVVYSPPVTRFMEAAGERGAEVANGLSMLVHQGAISFELWTGREPDTGLMRRAVMG